MSDYLKQENFKGFLYGKEIGLFSLHNNNGVDAYFTNYGARIIGLRVPTPGKPEKKTDVVIGLESISAYKESTEAYFGATIGRYANRIAKGKFVLEGKEYSVPVNNGGNALHGGISGFQDVVWEVSEVTDNKLVFEYLSPDMEEGFPGNLKVKVIYLLTNENELKISYEASTDKTSVVNFTNHAFFNLNGEGEGSILDHQLQIYADKITPVNENLIPTGELLKVKGTPFDFLNAKRIGKDLEADHEQLRKGNGYDHNFVLNGRKGKGMNLAATVTGDQSGIEMRVYTEEPGMQFYTGNFLQGQNELKSGVRDNARTAFALETQHFPDAPNQPRFPSTRLDAGEVFRSSSIYEFIF